MIQAVFISGGPGNEQEISRKSCALFMNALSHYPDVFEIYHFDLNQELEWTRKDFSENKTYVFNEFATILQELDNPVIIPIIHGAYGEDGRISSLCEFMDIPCLFSEYTQSAMTTHKYFSDQILRDTLIKVPENLFLPTKENAIEKIKPFLEKHGKIVLLPPAEGSSFNMLISKDLMEIEAFLKNYWKQHKTLLIKQYISGIEYTVGVFEDIETGKHKVLPPIRITPLSASYFDYESKYQPGKADESFELQLPDQKIQELDEINRKLAKIFQMKTCMRNDFIYHPEEECFYFLEANTIPGMTENSLLPKSIIQAGYKLPQFMAKLLLTAVSGNEQREYLGQLDSL